MSIRQNLVNTATEGAIESVRINWVSVVSGSCYESKKDTFFTKLSLLGQNPQEH